MSELTQGRPEAPDALSADLGYALGVLFRSYLRSTDVALAGFPGGPRGYQVLAAAAEDQAGGQGVLATRLGIDKTVMTYLVDDLERAGLVERRPDPADRRNKRLVATDHGRSELAAARGRLQHAEEHLLTGLDPADRDVFRGLLRRLADRANSLDPIHDACQVVEDVAAEVDGAGGGRSRRRAAPGRA